MTGRGLAWGNMREIKQGAGVCTPYLQNLMRNLCYAFKHQPCFQVSN